MDYKNDWSNAKERFKAFWKRELIDRCCAAVFAPKKNSVYESFPFPEEREDQIRYWTDGEYILTRRINYFENTYFGGEAFPQISVNLGPSGHAGFFRNVRHEFKENTVWFSTAAGDSEYESFEFDASSFLYRKTIELADYFARESKGRFFVGMADDTGNADALAHIRGSENLLVDMLTEKERVKEALDRIQDVWLDINENVYNITEKANEGGSVIGWLSTWAEGKHNHLQCDLSVMISPELFEEFIIPELTVQALWNDSNLYHFDGVEQIKHLDSLLSIDKLDVIQWTRVAGQSSVLEYIPVLKKIQKAGIGLLISVSPDEIEPLMEQLSSKGLFLKVQASSEDEAEEILKKVGKLTHE